MIDPLNLFFISTTIIGIILTIYYGRKSIKLEKSKKKLERSDWKNDPDAISQIMGLC